MYGITISDIHLTAAGGGGACHYSIGGAGTSWCRGNVGTKAIMATLHTCDTDTIGGDTCVTDTISGDTTVAIIIATMATIVAVIMVTDTDTDTIGDTDTMIAATDTTIGGPSRLDPSPDRLHGACRDLSLSHGASSSSSTSASSTTATPTVPRPHTSTGRLSPRRVGSHVVDNVNAAKSELRSPNPASKLKQYAIRGTVACQMWPHLTLPRAAILRTIGLKSLSSPTGF